MFFHGRLKLGEGGQVSVQSNPEDAWVVGGGKDAEGAEGEVEGGMTFGSRLEGVEDAGDYCWWDVAKELEGQVDAYGVDPSYAGQTESFEGLGKRR